MIKYFLKAVLFSVLFTGLFVILSLINVAPAEYKRSVHGLIGTLAAFISTFIFLRVDKKTFTEIGLRFERKSLPRFFAGVLLGIGVMGILVIGVLWFGKTTVQLNPQANIIHFLWATAALLPLAFMEELGFRAYPLQILKDRVGVRLAIMITAVLFALYHIANGWSVASSFYGPAVWGLLFGIAAVYSKGIALPTGIHYAANLTSAAFSETTDSKSLFLIHASAKPSAVTSVIDWAVILPSLFLLIFSILCIEIYLRRRRVSDDLEISIK